MKLRLPIEHAIQQKAEQYGDEDLQRFAIEVSDMKREIARYERANARNSRVFEIIFYVSLAVFVVSMLARWSH